MLDDLTQELRQPTSGAIHVLFLSAWVLVCMWGGVIVFCLFCFHRAALDRYEYPGCFPSLVQAGPGPLSHVLVVMTEKTRG